MKKSISIFAVLIVLMSSFSMINNSEYFNWKITSYDFGEIELNKPVTAEFSFENKSTRPIKIVSAKGSCGCTVPKYSKEEIQPGESGSITATYNAAKVGVFKKSVTLKTNTEESFTLYVSGEVTQ